jgi:hypothetical protein
MDWYSLAEEVELEAIRYFLGCGPVVCETDCAVVREADCAEVEQPFIPVLPDK